MKNIIILILLFIAGCSASNTIREPEIYTRRELVFYFYDNQSDLQKDYRDFTGQKLLRESLEGFYSQDLDGVHCLKWDFCCLGHEVMHALNYESNPPLFIEEDKKFHFDMNSE